MVLFSGLGPDAQNQAVILSWKKTPDTKVLAEVCRWALALALLQEVQWCYLHCHGLLLRVSIQGQRIHERDGSWVWLKNWWNPMIKPTCHYFHWICWVQNLSTFGKSIQCSGSWRSGLAGPEPELLKMPVLFHSYSKQQKVYISFMLFNQWSTSARHQLSEQRFPWKMESQRTSDLLEQILLWTHLTFSFLR